MICLFVYNTFFLGINSLLFSDIIQELKSTVALKGDRAHFLGKIQILEKVPKKVKNGPETRFFTLKKMKSFVLSGNGLKVLVILSFRMVLIILHKPHIQENCFSKLCIQKYSWPIKFEYSLNLSMSGMDWCQTWILSFEQFCPCELSANEICVFFDPQYLLNGLVSDFDLLRVDKQ